MNLQVIRGTATGIAQQAAMALMPYFNQPHHENTKSTGYDIVTEGDLASEKVIVAALQDAFPDHYIVSEEGGGSDKSTAEAEYFWYIDPIDGTSNFANNIPLFSICLALADRDKNPLVGIIYNPVHNEMFSAALGHGATLNGRAISVSGTQTLDQAILCTGFPYHKATSADNNLSRWNAFLPQVRGLRRLGSAALDMAWVACGRLDGYWEGWLNPWDCLGGILLIREAGGTVTDYDGSSDGLTGDTIIASNGHLHQQIYEVIASTRTDSAG